MYFWLVFLFLLFAFVGYQIVCAIRDHNDEL